MSNILFHATALKLLIHENILEFEMNIICKALKFEQDPCRICDVKCETDHDELN